MNLYLLFYDYDGQDESWNTFCTPFEVFPNADLRAQRMAWLKKTYPGLDLEPRDVEMGSVESIESPSKHQRDIYEAAEMEENQ